MKTNTIYKPYRKIWLAALLALSFFSQLLVAQQPKNRKNIVLVMADDFNYWNGVVQYFENFKPHTPNINALATKGVLFSDAQAPSPVCNPSRTAMFTGLRPSTTEITGNSDGSFRLKEPFTKIVPMHQYFKDNQYYVHGIGKLLHDSAGGKKGSDKENFSSYSSTAIGCQEGSFINYKGDYDIEYSVNDQELSESNCKDLVAATEAAKLISEYSKEENKDRNKNFFIGCGVSKPHLGWHVPIKFYNRYKNLSLPTSVLPGYLANDRDDTNQGPSQNFGFITDNNKSEEIIKMYLSCLTLADHNAGVVFNAVENSIYRDNTIVVFMGDHGWLLGEKDWYGKTSPWDKGNRTTLVIYDPTYKNTSGEPRVCSKVVSLQDIYPTLVELSGIPLKTDIEGVSLAPLIENPAKEDWDKPVLVTREVHRLRTNKWSYSRSADQSYINEDFVFKQDMLYDISKDPHEFNNLLNPKLPIPKSSMDIKKKLDKQIDSIIAIGTTLKMKIADNYVFEPKIVSIPGTIEAEEYDEGGYNQAYYDADTKNQGKQYRTLDGTDIYRTDDATGFYHLADLSEGEWLNYSVKDFIPGNYQIDFRIRNKAISPAVIQVFNRDKLLTEFTVPKSTNSWTNIKTARFFLDNQYSTRLQVKIKSGSQVEFNKMTFNLTLSNPELTANSSRKVLTKTVVDDGVLYLDLISTDLITNLSIYDIGGKLISSNNMPGEQMVAFTPKVKLQPGVYFLQVKDDFISSIEKFIVK